jgi:hypothetical protein
MHLAVAGGFDTSLPWYFGVAVFGAWAALIVILGFLVRRRAQVRAERRAEVRRGQHRTATREGRALGPGTDVEVW